VKTSVKDVCERRKKGWIAEGVAPFLDSGGNHPLSGEEHISHFTKGGPYQRARDSSHEGRWRTCPSVAQKVFIVTRSGATTLTGPAATVRSSANIMMPATSSLWIQGNH